MTGPTLDIVDVDGVRATGGETGQTDVIVTRHDVEWSETATRGAKNTRHGCNDGRRHPSAGQTHAHELGTGRTPKGRMAQFFPRRCIAPCSSRLRLPMPNALGVQACVHACVRRSEMTPRND